jgi:hypothetical protein
MALIEDINGDVETVSFFNFSTDIGDPDWLHSGAILLIKEPYLKYASLSRSEETKCAVLRIDSPSGIISPKIQLS